MKILFVCRSNVGRSQMAESIFNRFSKNHSAKSAGINPGKWEGKHLEETKYVAPSLKEIGIDATKNISKAITDKVAMESDKIIVMGVDKEFWPEYLKKSKKVEIWDIEDPAHKGMEEHRRVRDIIKKKVSELIRELNN